jgi:hypothetical protein
VKVPEWGWVILFVAGALLAAALLKKISGGKPSTSAFPALR